MSELAVIAVMFATVADTTASSRDAVHSAGRLVKSTAFELFDEDANTESPTVSQKSNHDNIGLLCFHSASFIDCLWVFAA